MKLNERTDKRLFLPVRRKLVCVAIAYLSGVFLALYLPFPVFVSVFLCAFLLGCAALRRVRRKSALLCLLGVFLFLGNGLTARELSLRDQPTAPGVRLTGRVCAVEKPLRVYLEDVKAYGQPLLRRNALVTLMLEKEETADDGVPSVLVGQMVSGTGRLFAPEQVSNPGEVDRRIRALVDGYELSGYILPGWTAEGSESFSLREWLRIRRQELLGCVQRLFGERAALFQGVMLGDRSALDDDVTSAMRLTGTAHVLTVSGMHLGMIAAALSAVLRRTGLGRYARFGILSILLSAFACLTGGAAGTVRALIMAMMREWARLRGRKYEPLTGLAAAALAMTLVRPLWALDASFQFSYFVMLGILLIGQSVTCWLSQMRVPGILRKLLLMVAVSMSAQIAALPIQLLFYGYIPLLALPMNFICGLMMPLLLLGGWICVLISVLPVWAYALPAALLGRLGGWFEAMSLAAASAKWGILRLPAPYRATVILFAAMMALFSSRIRFGERRRSVAAGVALILLLSYMPRLCPLARYVQLDVGQGDAALFRSGRRAVLVDVGPADSYDMLRYLRHEGLFVDTAILSHLDEDHAGALSVLLDSEIEIGSVVMAEGAKDKEVSQAVIEGLEKIEAQGVPVYEVRRGDMLSIEELRIDVLSPDELRLGSNERSLLLHAQMESTSFLLTGDLPQDSEPEDIPRCDVLKVAHHGSANATSEAFLKKARPSLALISVGENNSYGHPTERVLDALDRVGSDVLRTDQSGCITLWLRDGVCCIQRFIQ